MFATGFVRGKGNRRPYHDDTELYAVIAAASSTFKMSKPTTEGSIDSDCGGLLRREAATVSV